MKSKLLLVSLIMMANIVFAQSYYILPKTGTHNEPQGNYVFNTLGKVVIQGNLAGLPDTLSAWQTLPFAWNFYGNPVTGYYISDNGYISFDPATKASNPNNTVLPDTNAPKNAIFAHWDALVQCDADGQSTNTNLIHSWTYGTAPNRVHVIHWFRTYREPYTTDKVSQPCFGIRIFESGLKAFDIVYDWRYLPTGGTVITNSATVGCQNADATASTTVNGSPAIDFPNISNANSDDVVYEFCYGSQPTLDLSVIKLNITDIAKTNTYVSINGTLRNFGSVPITSLTLNYRIDGGSVVSELINNPNIESGGTYDFSHSDLYNTLPMDTNNKIEVWASNLNGGTDQNNANDTMKWVLQVVNSSSVRLPLHEVFTSSTCPPCKPGNEKLQEIFDANPDKYTCVKYQMYFPGDGDPYYTSECGTRSTYYGGISSVPRLEVDGGWNSNPGSYTQTVFDEYYNAPSFVDIDAKYTISPYQYDPTDTTVTIDVTITPYANYAGYSPKLYMAIVESNTTRNVKSNGETEFYDVLKKMVPNANGLTLAKLEKGKSQTVSKLYTFKGKYKLPPDANSPINLLSQNSVEDYNNLLVVAWIQDDNTKKVLQSTWGGRPTSIMEKNARGIITGFYPNPATDHATVKFKLDKPEIVSFAVMNMLGQNIMLELKYCNTGENEVKIPLSDLKQGSYVLIIKTETGTSSVTFIK
jgi:hypothetical protein